MKKFALTAALALMIAAPGVQAADQKEAGEAIAQAISAVNAAAQVRGEWRDSYKTIGKAKKAYKKGDYDEALKLAKKAKGEGEMGQAQAMAEANAGNPGYLK